MSKLTFKNCVITTAGLENMLSDGLKGLKHEHRACIIAGDSRKIRGSVYLDDAMKSCSPRDRCWDYGIGYENTLEDIVHWIEVHPAVSGEIKVVIEKQQSLINWLNTVGSCLSKLKCYYYWVPSKDNAILPHAPQYKKLISHQPEIQLSKRVKLN